MALLRQIINFGVSRGITGGTRKKVPVPPMPGTMVTEDLNDAQLHELIKALDAEADQDAADIVRLVMLTGARRAEVMKLLWDDVRPLKKAFGYSRSGRTEGQRAFRSGAGRGNPQKAGQGKGDLPERVSRTGQGRPCSRSPGRLPADSQGGEAPRGLPTAPRLAASVRIGACILGVNLFVVSKLLGAFHAGFDGEAVRAPPPGRHGRGSGARGAAGKRGEHGGGTGHEEGGRGRCILKSWSGGRRYFIANCNTFPRRMRGKRRRNGFPTTRGNCRGRRTIEEKKPSRTFGTCFERSTTTSNSFPGRVGDTWASGFPPCTGSIGNTF